ncbi:MAG TPA: cysteine--tRNA ligase [Bacteroidales bacterium]|nr:cysteine--tRNA ligase [Bacteroidales bacterium]
MQNHLVVYNSLSRKKEPFEPLNPPFVGMYVCGPTVYGDAHLGHARPAVTFDLIFRYLQNIGYKVRYVRNITDVGHLESDADEGEDKIGKKARLEQLEPMEVVQYFSDRYHEDMHLLNVKKPSIEPRASGHIIEQIEMVKAILDAEYAYVVNGSVYFNVEKYHKKYKYGRLSGRVLDEMMSGYRELESQDEKQSPFDFALWKKAGPEHLMSWPSPWGVGFPGWHLECSAMSAKYLGEVFDIHGGGMDLLFPHHECEIAQSNASNGKDPVRYWLHNNMITINGQKMGKSLGNFITLREFFSGKHNELEHSFNPMTIRFFILQAHYRSTLDFSNEALKASDKGLKRLLEAHETLRKIKPSEQSTVDVKMVGKKCYAALNDDFNSPLAIAHLFDVVRIINSVTEKNESLSEADLAELKATFDTFIIEILGLKTEAGSNNEKLQGVVDGLMQMIIDFRQEARQQKDWGASDRIRENLAKLNISVNDGKEGTTWDFTQ